MINLILIDLFKALDSYSVTNTLEEAEEEESSSDPKILPKHEDNIWEDD